MFSRADERPHALPAFEQLPNEDIPYVASGTGDKVEGHMR